MIEAAGAVLLLPVFLWDYKGKGIWLSVYDVLVGMVVKAYYSDNTSKTITDYTVSGYDPTKVKIIAVGV